MSLTAFEIFVHKFFLVVRQLYQLVQYPRGNMTFNIIDQMFRFILMKSIYYCSVPFLYYLKTKKHKFPVSGGIKREHWVVMGLIV